MSKESSSNTASSIEYSRLSPLSSSSSEIDETRTDVNSKYGTYYHLTRGRCVEVIEKEEIYVLKFNIHMIIKGNKLLYSNKLYINKKRLKEKDIENLKDTPRIIHYILYEATTHFILKIEINKKVNQNVDYCKCLCV